MRNRSILAIFAVVLAGALALGSTGLVSLARTEGSEEETAAQKDRLVGILVTKEYLDLFDMESYLEDNIDQLMKDGTVSVEESAQYNERLYATLVDRTHTNEETGEKGTHAEFVFEGVEGFLYYEAKVEREGESYYTSGGDEAFSDGHLGITVNDAGESIDMKCTIYTSTSGALNCLYYNPVYQSADGSVYAVTGNGHSYGGELTEGMCSTVTLEENNSVTLDGETAEYGTRIEISHMFMYPPEKIIVTQMNGANQMVESHKYEPGKVPKELDVREETEYIIVETVKTDHQKKKIRTREMYEREDNYISTFYCREDDVCVKQEIRVNWGE